MFEGVGENAGIGFTLGGLVNFVAAIAGGRRGGKGNSERAGATLPESGDVDSPSEKTSNSDEPEAEQSQSGSKTDNSKNPEENFPRARLRKYLRPVVEHLPDKFRARFDLAEFMDRADYPLPGWTAEQYFAPVWDRLDPQMQEFLEERYRNFAGSASERIVRDTLDAAEFKRSKTEEERTFEVPADPKTEPASQTVVNNKPETRIFNEVVSQDIKRGLLKLFAGPGASNQLVKIEVKGQSSGRSAKQTRNDEATTSSDKPEMSGIELLRVPADRIKPEHLADVIGAWLNQPTRRKKDEFGDYQRKDIEDLVKLLRAQHGPDGKPLSVGVVLAVTLSFALPLAYPESGEAEEAAAASDSPGR